MTSTTMALPASHPARKSASLKRDRRWALITSYVFLVIFAIFFLIPPYYMVVTALKSDAEVAHMATNPWSLPTDSRLISSRSCSRRPTS